MRHPSLPTGSPSQRRKVRESNPIYTFVRLASNELATIGLPSMTVFIRWSTPALVLAPKVSDESITVSRWSE